MPTDPSPYPRYDCVAHPYPRLHAPYPNGHEDAHTVSHCDEDPHALPDGHGHLDADAISHRDEDPHALPNGHGQRRL
jgi:hypothetical protein|nr:hypothetical protein [Thermoflexus sp.]